MRNLVPLILLGFCKVTFYSPFVFLAISSYFQEADNTQNTINDYDISVVRSNEALWIYKEAFETVDSVNPKQIRDFLLKKIKN